MSTEPAALGGRSRGGQDGGASASAEPTARGLTWRKSVYSDGTTECLEVARCPDGGVLLRDSRHPGEPAIEVSAQAWRTFIRALRSDELQ